MDKRPHVRIGLVGLVAVGLSLAAFAAVPTGVGMGMHSTRFMGVIEALPGGGLLGDWTVTPGVRFESK